MPVLQISYIIALAILVFFGDQTIESLRSHVWLRAACYGAVALLALFYIVAPLLHIKGGDLG